MERKWYYPNAEVFITAYREGFLAQWENNLRIACTNFCIKESNTNKLKTGWFDAFSLRTLGSISTKPRVTTSRSKTRHTPDPEYSSMRTQTIGSNALVPLPQNKTTHIDREIRSRYVLNAMDHDHIFFNSTRETKNDIEGTLKICGIRRDIKCARHIGKGKENIKCQVDITQFNLVPYRKYFGLSRIKPVVDIEVVLPGRE